VLRHPPCEGAACWDIGAHFGYYTALFAKSVGRSGEVIAVEPNPFSFTYLKRHVGVNRLKQVRIFNAAASERDGQGQLLNYGHPHSPTVHLRFPDESVSPEIVRGETELIALDTLTEKENLRLPRVIKIDVEGHTAEVLRGSSNTLERAMPILFIALHTQTEWEQVESILGSIGYRPPRVVGTAVQSHELKDCIFEHLLQGRLL